MSERVQKILEAAGAIVLLGWRLAAQGAHAWRDWLAVLACLWLVAALGGKPRLTAGAAAGAGLFLLALYATGQAPHTLRALGLAP